MQNKISLTNYIPSLFLPLFQYLCMCNMSEVNLNDFHRQHWIGLENSPGWPFFIEDFSISSRIKDRGFVYQGLWIVDLYIKDHGFLHQGSWIVDCILLHLMLTLENSPGLPSDNSRGRPVVTSLCSWQQPFQAKIDLSTFQNVFVHTEMYL